MHATKNYTGKGGSETVIGGKLLIKGTVEIAPTAKMKGIPAAAYQSNVGSDVSTVAALRAELNKLLAGLQAAKLMAPAPTITVIQQPEDLALVAGSIAATDKLQAAFFISNGGVMTYQWFSNAADANTGGTPVDGATGDSYTIPAGTAAGTTYYYCVASHEGVTQATEAAAVVVTEDTDPA